MKTTTRRAAAASSSAANQENDPPSLVKEEEGSVRLPNTNISHNDDNDEDEEMISLGLSRANSISGGGNNGASANHTGTPGAISMVGTNRKSTFPATPATPAAASASRMHQRNSGGGGGAPIRRTPGPMSVAHQARHRRTPGAGHSQDNPEINRSHARTPVMSGGGSRHGKTPHKLPPASSSALVTPSIKSQNNASAMETPNVNNSGSKDNNMNQQHQLHQRQLYTPAHFTLAKNADLHMENRPDAFSPATIRMTNSLEKLLTDDDDILEAKHHTQSQSQQQMPKEEDVAANSQKMNTNGNNDAMFNTYPKTQELYRDPRTQEEIAMASRAAFRRIQSTGSGSDDEEMEEMKDLPNTSKASDDSVDDGSSQEEEEEAEISQINEDEDDDEDDNDDQNKSGGPTISRPKPLNFAGLNTSDGGQSTGVSVSSGGAFQPAKRVVPTTTPKPQRTIPRHAAPAYPSPGGHHHPNQGQGGGGMYYPQQQHQGYFGQENMMGGPHQHMNHQHLQYSPHHQYGPPQPHHHHHHHPSQNFHLPSMPSPQNAGFGHIPPVSPLTIPTDFSHGPYHPHSHANANAGGSYVHHTMHNIHGPGIGAGGGEHWWRGGPGHPDGGAAGFDPTMMSHQHPHGMLNPHHDHLQQQGGGMGGIIPIPGHASPDFSFHELSGAVSPFTLPHHPSFPTAPHPTHHSNNYHHQQQHHHHHQQHHYSSQGTAPAINHSGSASPATPRQRTKSKEDHPRGGSNRKTPPSLTASPTKQQYQGSPGQRGMRPRKDSTASINSAFSGGGDEQGGNLSFSQTLSSPGSSSTPVLKQGLLGLNTSTSSEDELEYSNWFHPPQKNNDLLLFQHVDSGSRQQQNLGHENYLQQPKLRTKKGNHLQPLGTNLSGPGSNNNNRHSVGGERNKPQQQGSKKPSANKPMRDRIQLPHNLDIPRTKANGGGGSRAMGPSSFHHGSSGADNDDKQKQGEFVMESPTERQAFKEFGRNFRQRENESLAAARDYALACLSESNRDIYLPPATHWRVYLELADVAKRSNQIEDARSHYRQACMLQPRASQGWLEHSKLEEECGNLHKCASILQEGLTFCTTNENLLIRAVKYYERMGDLDKARQLLSRLKYLSIEKSWKTMLEGALLEARAGRYSMAREVLKFLTHNVPWYGPLYLAHTKLERDYGSSSEAFSIVEKGLKELPRYGPLYFQAFRLLEKEDISQKAFDLPRTMDMVSRADSISRELLWKVHLEAAQMQERAALLAVEDNPKKLDLRMALKATRRSYAKAIMLCPANLSWKIWLASGRTEVSCGNTKGAWELFLRAHDSVSEKGRSTVLLECARLEEYCGDLALSRSILCKARHQFGKSDWKVWLSSVNLECRCGLRERAIAFAQEALNIHRGTGRLWAALIQLRHDDGELNQMKVLKHALQAVPKSGEVWCEGARIYLNPFSPTFDLQAASRHLSFAARFTPQYGDSFLEQLRLNMIDQWLIPLATPFINSMCEKFRPCDQMQIEDAYQFITEHTKNAADVVKTQLKEKNPVKKDVLDTSELELRCSSADPNYGHLWFQCRASPIDTAREVITRAKTVLADSIIDYSYLYVAAMVRRAGMLMLIHLKNAGPKVSAQEIPQPNSHRWDLIVDKQLRAAPSLDEILSEKIEGPILFTTGCVGSNHNWDKLSLTDKRRILFGSDSLLS